MDGSRFPPDCPRGEAPGRPSGCCQTCRSTGVGRGEEKSTSWNMWAMMLTESILQCTRPPSITELAPRKGASTLVPTARTDFNLYAVGWTPTEITGYVNDLHYFTFDNERMWNSDADMDQWPFDHPFHLILNIAVGGSWGGQQGIDPNIWPQRMEVDYVRVYSCDM